MVALQEWALRQCLIPCEHILYKPCSPIKSYLLRYGGTGSLKERSLLNPVQCCTTCTTLPRPRSVEQPTHRNRVRHHRPDHTVLVDPLDGSLGLHFSSMHDVILASSSAQDRSPPVSAQACSRLLLSLNHPRTLSPIPWITRLASARMQDEQGTVLVSRNGCTVIPKGTRISFALLSGDPPEPQIFGLPTEWTTTVCSDWQTLWLAIVQVVARSMAIPSECVSVRWGDMTELPSNPGTFAVVATILLGSLHDELYDTLWDRPPENKCSCCVGSCDTQIPANIGPGCDRCGDEELCRLCSLRLRNGAQICLRCLTAAEAREATKDPFTQQRLRVLWPEVLTSENSSPHE